MGELYAAIVAAIYIIFCAVGAYGLGTLIAEYDGPFDLFIKIRKFGKLFKCSTCLGFWFAVILSLVAGLGLVETVATIGLTTILTREL